MTSNHVSRPINSGRSNATTPALSVTNRTLCVVRNSTSGTGQSVPFSTTSMRQAPPGGPIPAATRGEQARVETKKASRSRRQDAPPPAKTRRLVQYFLTCAAHPGRRVRQSGRARSPNRRESLRPKGVREFIIGDGNSPTTFAEDQFLPLRPHPIR